MLNNYVRGQALPPGKSNRQVDIIDIAKKC